MPIVNQTPKPLPPQEDFEHIRQAPPPPMPQERMGGSYGNAAPSVPQPSVQDQIKKMDELDKSQSAQAVAKIRAQLEEEMRRLRMMREEQLRQRRQEPTTEQAQAQRGMPEAKNQPLVEPAAKPKGGLFSLGKPRVKTAQTLSQPETAGRRTGE